jgi:hypothetical protein
VLKVDWGGTWKGQVEFKAEWVDNFLIYKNFGQKKKSNKLRRFLE